MSLTTVKQWQWVNVHQLLLLNYGASARLAVAESITNIAGTDIGDLNRIKLSANWMSPAGHPGEDAGLYEAVKAVGEELCPALRH